MNKQITDTLMMVRPVAFYKNEQTAVNNYYQKMVSGLSNKEIQESALREFDRFVEKLIDKGVVVHVFEDTNNPEKPDAVFPNNWVSFHESGEVILYPMYAENRRYERREDILTALEESYHVKKVFSLTDWEHRGKFLEGTGSLVLDRTHKIGYVALSPRANTEVINDFISHTGYEVITFVANLTIGGKRLPIYHTNVMMCIGESFAVACMDSIDDKGDKESLMRSFERTGKELISTTENQNERFAGNMLQVENSSGHKLVVMSESAFKSLNKSQIQQLEKHGELVYSSLDIIECLGGGSARCMMAEVFLPKK